MNTQNRYFDISSFSLHILAMGFMLMDHMWAAAFPNEWWLNCIGRLAFPIFAFMMAEGYFYTKNRKKHYLRLLAFALLSEIPFDLLYTGTWFYPYHQNVLWTFLIALTGIHIMEATRKKNRLWLTCLVSFLTVLMGYFFGYAGFVDFYGPGVLTVFVFYFFHGRKWWCYLGQFVALYWLNVELLGGMYYPVQILGREVELMQQSFALLALIPIWLYRGRKGPYSKLFQYFCYAFYPLHCLILGLYSIL